MRYASQFLVLSFLIGLVGCQDQYTPPKLYPVTGTLVVGGKPLPNITVQLIPAQADSTARPGVGTTDAEGKFAILTNGDKGVTPGKYKVVLLSSNRPKDKQDTVEDAMKIQEEMMKKMAQSGGARPAVTEEGPPFPQQWADASTTPKEVDVGNQPVTVNIDI